MAEAFPQNFRQKLWMVTGKGGVGKTTTAAALGLWAARSGLNTLLVETHGLSHLGNVFSLKEESYRPEVVAPNLSLLQITPEKAFEEYVLQQIKLKVIFNAVFKNKYVRHFIDAAPGLNELLTIGKIWALVEGKYSTSGMQPYDLVVVDAPATGHGLSLLTVPEIVADAVRVGPLRTKALDILNVLRDPQKTLVWLVTLPEEMPVNEAAEMNEKLESVAKVRVGPLLMNCLWPTLLKEEALKEILKGTSKNEIVEVYRRRLELNRFYIDKLKSRCPNRQTLELPLIYETQAPKKIAEKLSEVFATKLG